MNYTDIKQYIELGIEKKFHLCIERKECDDIFLYCIPLKVSDDLLCFAYMYDFEFDGIKIIRLKDITSVRHAKQEAFVEMVCEKERIVIPVLKKDICIDNIETTLKNVQKQNIIIECEQNEENTFFIGKIVRFDADGIEFIEFDGTGVWQTNPVFIKYYDITCITISGRYLDIMSKYTNKDKIYR